ncbi:60S ribosomal protein L23a [Plasmodium falciparum RAJ116]|uniref:60S ribosomal protein L23a n=1 Tax=Plasmodium falciparum RAJ116 TaxID=580058 RepID=A0A0L0CYT7_PLAFA|nr:60S ribosomal protein L23a [Plasmodium falciparum RAJ116]
MTQVEKKKKEGENAHKHPNDHNRDIKKRKRKYTNGNTKVKYRKQVVKKTINKNVSKKKLLKENVDKDEKKKKNENIHSPKTLIYARNPKCPRIVKSCHSKTLDKYGLIKYPLTSEKAMKKIEEINTLVFMCDKRANKKNIKKSVKNLFGIECDKVNVLNTYVLRNKKIKK